MMTTWIKARVVIFGLLLVVLAFLVGRRAVQLQVREAAQLREWAQNNYLSEIQIPPRRGRILDHRGNELASTAELDSVFANPRQLSHVPEAARKLGQALHLDAREVEKLLATKQSQYFAWIKRRVGPDESKAVMALGLPGVGTRREPRRIYPNGQLAATVIGYAGLDGSGLEGVELAFDKELHGTGMEVVGVHDRLGRDLLVDGVVDSSSSAGKDLTLTLDRYLTYETERVLAETVQEHNAKAGMAVMLDPHTGDILAMASVPTYNPNDPADAVKRGARNRTIADAFEPGSTLKTFTFAAALDAGKVRPEDRIDCQMGSLVIGKFHIRDDHPKGILSAAEVFKFSSNIGTVKNRSSYWQGGAFRCPRPLRLWQANRGGAAGRATGNSAPGLPLGGYRLCHSCLRAGPDRDSLAARGWVCRYRRPRHVPPAAHCLATYRQRWSARGGRAS